MLEFLERIFQRVRFYIHSERFDRNQVYFQSDKHKTMQFDRDAEDLIISSLEESPDGFEVITEERPSFTTRPEPRYRIMIDPIDGSDNVARGITIAGIALAVLPIDAPISPTYVEWALVGDLFSGTVYQSKRGSGAFCNGQPCYVSDTRQFEQCLIGINFDGSDLDVLRKLLIEKPRPQKVRRSGSSAMDVVYIANGAYDAYVDIGDSITAESFLASLSIVLEAGGIISDEFGRAIRNVSNLNEVFSLVVAGTKELHQEILVKINS